MRDDSKDPWHGLWLVFIVLVGINLRPFLTAIGPLAESIRIGTGLGYRDIAWLTMLPLLIMGAGAFFEPIIRRLFGARQAMVGALVLVGVGSGLRLVASSGELLIATAALCGLGVAVAQSIIPGIIKQRFPHRVAVAAGSYSAALMLGGALGAQFTPLLERWIGGWNEALAWWAAPVLLALFLAWRIMPARPPAAGSAAPTARLLRRPRTWLLMVCFGLTNTGYAALVAWLPPFYQSMGWSPARSGSLIAIMSLAQASAAMLLPTLSGRNRDRRAWLGLTLSLQAAGFAAFAFWPEAAPHAWVIAVGVGLGGTFALMLVVALDHLARPDQAGALSAFMLGGGFIIAAIAPWLIALLHQITGSFTSGWLAQLAGVILLLALTLRLAPEGYATAMGETGAPPA
ncbi:MAG: cyanate transporter [Rhodospirillales bacterium]|nr:cyanate transporter [Rhodospirillales bacterium]